MKIRSSTGKVYKVNKADESKVRQHVADSNFEAIDAMFRDQTDLPEAKSGIHIKKKNRGLLHKNLGVPKGKKIPASKLKVKSTDSPAVKKRKVFAQNARKWNKENGGEVEQVMQMIAQALQQGATPEQVMDMLVKQGVPQEVAQQAIQQVMSQGQLPQALLGDEVGVWGSTKPQVQNPNQPVLFPVADQSKNTFYPDDQSRGISTVGDSNVQTTPAPPVTNGQPITTDPTQIKSPYSYQPMNMSAFWNTPYYTQQALYGYDERNRHQAIKKNLQDEGASTDEMKRINKSITGDRLRIAGGIMGQVMQDASNVLGGISTGIHNQRVRSDEQDIMNFMRRRDAQIRPYNGDLSELGGGTRAGYYQYGGKLGYLDHGGINNGNGIPNVVTERGEITNNGTTVFKEGGDLHSDPSGGNTRSYRPGTVVHSKSIGMEAGDLLAMLPMYEGGEYAASKIGRKYDPKDKISFADAAEAFITSTKRRVNSLDKDLGKINEKIEKEELYSTSPNETKVSQVTSKLNLKTLSKRKANLEAQKAMNLAVTGPTGPLHLISEGLKKSGAYGEDIKDESMEQAKYGKKIKLPMAGNGWTDPTPAQYRKLAAMEWLGTDQPSPEQLAKGFKQGFNAGIDPKLLVSYLKNSGYTPPNNNWDEITEEHLQNYVYDWDSNKNQNKVKEYLYNHYLPTIQGLDWFKEKGYSPNTPFYQLDPEDIDKVFKDRKLGVRFGEAAGLMNLGAAPSVQDPAGTTNTPYTPSSFTAPSIGKKNARRPYYTEALNPNQIIAPMIDLLTPNQAVPYIENEGYKKAAEQLPRQRFTDIQPQLNRLRRATLAQSRGTSPIDQARSAQAYSNEYEMANQVYGQKYNMDNQIEQNYNSMQAELLGRAGAEKARALDTLAQRTATRDWKGYALRRNAAGEIGNKTLKNILDNRTSVLYQDMIPDFGYNPMTGTDYQGNWSPQVGSMFPFGSATAATNKGYTEERWTDPETGHEHVERVPKTKYGGKVKLPKKSPKRVK